MELHDLGPVTGATLLGEILLVEGDDCDVRIDLTDIAAVRLLMDALEPVAERLRAHEAALQAYRRRKVWAWSTEDVHSVRADVLALRDGRALAVQWEREQ